MIKIGTVINLELIPNDKNKKEKQKVMKYKCKLIDRSKNAFIVDEPVNVQTGKSEHFYEGTEFNLSFIGIDGAIYSFKTELLAVRKGKITMYKLSDPGKEKYLRTQRRSFVRVEVTTDVAIHPKNPKYKPFRTYTIDISGGGLLIAIPKHCRLPKEGQVICYIALPMQSGEIHYVQAECKIVRQFQKEELVPLMLASLQITDIKERDQEKIIRYCFEHELLSKQK